MVRPPPTRSLTSDLPTMSAILRIAITTLAAQGLVCADLPKKAPLSKYSDLWTKSPFTSKPPPPPPPDEIPAFEDYALAGVSPIEGGYRVTLLDKKNPEKRIFIFSDDPGSKDGFKILGVTRDPDKPRGTVVRLSSGSQTGTVTYDDKLMTLAAPPPPQNPQQAQPQMPGQPQPQLQPGQMPQRQPRPRVVPPPVPGQPQPQAQPRVQINQPQGQPQQNTQRFDRQDRRGGRGR